jgi:PPOX class probable F420-dependent enzyme
MDADAARALFAMARVARLATVGADGRPHVVPITFALDGDTLYTAVDHKPKRTTRLRRLENVAANPRVSVLADHYEDQDWSALWWVRADGVARIVAPNDPQRTAVSTLLQARYEQYRRLPPTGPAIALSISRWSGWRAADARQG